MLDAGSDGRRGGSIADRALRWLLVDGNPLLIASGLCLALFATLLSLGSLDVIAFEDQGPATRVASGLIAGSFTIVTLVVTLDQLVYSREFGDAGDLHDRLQGVMSFREDVEALTGVPASPEVPGAFMKLLAIAIADRANELAAAVERSSDEAELTDVSSFARSLRSDALDARDQFGAHEFDSFGVLRTAIEFEDSRRIYVVRRLRAERGDRLSEDAQDALDDLLEALQLFNVARGHFKTIAVQREFARSSRQILYVGGPAIVAAVLLGLLYATPAGATLSRAALPVVVSALVTVVLAPLALLTAHGVRASVIAQRTATIGPTVTDTDRLERPDWAPPVGEIEREADVGAGEDD